MSVSSKLYSDIAERTGGEIYIGVVGPVRTGKSTFIKKFMDTLVLPNIENDAGRERAVDTLPQSAAGRTVMTTEPKFVPENAAHITLDDNVHLGVRLIDCVGYIVPGAAGLSEDGNPRMVSTPWQEEPMPFEEAAEIGTRKVINEHSTIGVLVTTDGSFGEIPREAYIEAENRVASELSAQNKPFVIVLNSSNPQSEEAQSLAMQMEEDYGVPVALVSCLELDETDIRQILSLVLLEFPVKEIRAEIPSWVSSLTLDHPLRSRITEGISEIAEGISRIGQINELFEGASEEQFGTAITVSSIDLGAGKAHLNVSVPGKLFYKILGDEAGFEIKGEEELISIIKELSDAKRKYDKLADALMQVEQTGYGIVTPAVEDLTLEEPEIVKQAGGYGVKLRAWAPSIHMIRADINAEVSPIVGSEKQSEDMVKFLLKEFEEDPSKIWESNMFGKTLHELVGEGLNAKLAHMPVDARTKLADTLRRIINEGSNGLICILL